MIKVNNDYYLSEIGIGDKGAYLTHLKEKEIYDNTLNIPYPYTEKSVDFWIDLNLKKLKEQPTPTNFAIRRADGFLIGGVGCDGLKIGKTHKAEIGYWLAKPYWGHGLMTITVNRLCEHAFENWELRRITAHVFEKNQGSQKVLEKNGFQLEGRLRQHYLKDGQLLDARLYALLKNEFKNVKGFHK